MLASILKVLYTRDLEQLKQEITLYKSEENIWRIDQGISNSAGNLCLHLVGNLNAYIGAQLGNTGYIRNRPEEFSLKNIPKQELIARIDELIAVVETVFASLTEDQLKSEYPMVVLDGKVSTG